MKTQRLKKLHQVGIFQYSCQCYVIDLVKTISCVSNKTTHLTISKEIIKAIKNDLMQPYEFLVLAKIFLNFHVLIVANIIHAVNIPKSVMYLCYTCVKKYCFVLKNIVSLLFGSLKT